MTMPRYLSFLSGLLCPHTTNTSDVCLSSDCYFTLFSTFSGGRIEFGGCTYLCATEHFT